MFLPDHQIKYYIENGVIGCDPIPDWQTQLQPASLDVRLGTSFARFQPRHAHSRIDTVDRYGPCMTRHTSSEVTIDPGDFVLATTIEKITLPNDILARVEGRSSFGRLGIMVHVTAGFIDPGFEGNITLEMANLGNHPIRIQAKTRIAQLCFGVLTEPCQSPYKGKYQKQQSIAVPSKIHLDKN